MIITGVVAGTYGSDETISKDLASGGLANWLLLSSTVIGTAYLNSAKPVFNPNKFNNQHNKEIFRNLNFDENLEIESIFREDAYPYTNGLHYYPLPLFFGDTKITGYFFSEKYFSCQRNKILSLFSPTKETKELLVDRWYSKINPFTTVIIHVRRGDFIHSGFPILDMEYYNKALNLFENIQNIIVVSQDLEWCRNNFTNYDNIHFVNESEMEDLYLFTIIPNIIIANSSFSWWGAWLNNMRNRKIVSPDNHIFGGGINNRDIVPENWIING